MQNTSGLRLPPIVTEALKLAIWAVIAFIVVMIVLRVEKRLFQKIAPEKAKINIRFVEGIVRIVTIAIAVIWVMMSSSITAELGKVLFQSTAVLTAIVGFAGQKVISDMLCGLMISAARPFEIGDRIELEDGTAGVVEDMTLRHVKIVTMDTARAIIPNSKLNSMKLVNMSTNSSVRSAQFRFQVAYNAGTEKAREVIGQAVMDSPYTIPGKPGKEGNIYGPVYFLNYKDSSLEMGVTVYFKAGTPTEVVKSDVNTRVKDALEAAGIEIPYNYMNVVMKQEEQSCQGDGPFDNFSADVTGKAP